MAPAPALLATHRRRVESANLLALSNFSGANYYQSLVGGHEVGVSSGFGSAVLWRQNTAPSVSTPFMVGSNATNGHAFYFDAAGIRWRAASSAPAFVYTTPKPVNAQDFGRMRLAVGGYYPGGVLRMWEAREQFGPDVAITGYTPATAAAFLGNLAGNGFSQGDIAAVVTWRGAPTDSQVKALYDAVRTLGDIPSKGVIETLMPGTTVTHRQSLRDALAGQAVTDGQLAPASLADTVTGAAADAMTRTGSPVVRVIDASVDGRKSYGWFGASSTSFLQSATPGGIAGSATTGMHVRMLWRPEYLGTTRVLVGRGVIGGQGWWIQISGAGLTGVVGNGATATYTIQTSELYQWHVVELVLIGSTIRLYWDGAKVGADASAVFTPYAGPMIWGWCNHTGTNPGDRETYMALAGGDYGTTDAEVLAAYAETMRTGRIAGTSGKTQHIYDASLDIAPNPDAGVPAQILDRVGTAHLSRVGTDLQVSRRTERLWSYESTPVMHGARNLSASNYLRTTTGLAATSGSYWIALALLIHAKAGGSFQVLANKSSSSGSQGFNIYAAATLGNIAYSHGLGSGAQQAATYTVLDSDVGRVLLLGYQWTGSLLQSFVKRDRNGGDVAVGTYTPFTGAMMLGRHADTTSNATSDNVSILGLMGGTSPLTLAEWQADVYDAFVSEEDLIAVPGKTTRLWSVKRAQNGSLQAIPDAMGSGEVMTLTGAPTLSPIHAHAIAA